MDQTTRFAVYHAPRPGALADWAARWLGRDLARGVDLEPPAALPGLPRAPAALTAGPRRYGFHGTLRAPFRPAPGVGPAALSDCVAALAARLPPARAEGLEVSILDGFVALTPAGDTAAIGDLAAQVVIATDPLRAPLTAADIARRRPDSLTPPQRALLDRWGYPFVMEAFRFHLTLTDWLAPAEAQAVAAALAAEVAPVLPRPFVIEDLCLCAEDASGRFRLIERHALTG